MIISYRSGCRCEVPCLHWALLSGRDPDDPTLACRAKSHDVLVQRCRFLAVGPTDDGWNSDDDGVSDVDDHPLPPPEITFDDDIFVTPTVMAGSDSLSYWIAFMDAMANVGLDLVHLATKFRIVLLFLSLDAIFTNDLIADELCNRLPGNMRAGP